jgi:hypothetical protein
MHNQTSVRRLALTVEWIGAGNFLIEKQIVTLENSRAVGR